MIRASMRYVSYTDRKKLMPALRRVYSAPNAEEATRQLELFDEQWGERYPMLAQAWRDRWEHVTPFHRYQQIYAAWFTPQTRSRASTAKSAKRSRPADTSPTSKQQQSSSTSR
jgi:transposase-like protein